MITDKDIINKLPRKDARKLLNLCREYHPMQFSEFKLKKYEWDEILCNKYTKKERVHDITKYIENLETIINLYLSIENNEKNILNHWYKSFNEQQKIRKKYTKNNNPPRQDNKTYINKGSGYSNNNKIRYPRKKRKTAWKRFYKLFPHLKPEYKNK